MLSGCIQRSVCSIIQTMSRQEESSSAPNKMMGADTRDWSFKRKFPKITQSFLAFSWLGHKGQAQADWLALAKCLLAAHPE